MRWTWTRIEIRTIIEKTWWSMSRKVMGWCEVMGLRRILVGSVLPVRKETRGRLGKVRMMMIRKVLLLRIWGPNWRSTNNDAWNWRPWTKYWCRRKWWIILWCILNTRCMANTILNNNHTIYPTPRWLHQLVRQSHSIRNLSHINILTISAFASCAIPNLFASSYAYAIKYIEYKNNPIQSSAIISSNWQQWEKNGACFSESNESIIYLWSWSW